MDNAPAGTKPEDLDTQGLIIDFGKHKGTLYTRVPVSYLKWMVAEPGLHPNKKSIAAAELKRRGTTTPSLDLSGHALDRASLRVLDMWKRRINKEIGFYTWLHDRAKEALGSGREISPGKVSHDGITFVFAMEGTWPVLKSVIREHSRDDQE